MWITFFKISGFAGVLRLGESRSETKIDGFGKRPRKHAKTVSQNDPKRRPGEYGKSVGTLLQPYGEFHHVVVDILTLLHLVGDAVAGMHDRGVVLAAEHLADIHKAHTRHLTGEIHGDLPGEGDVLHTGTPHDIVEGEMEVLRRLADDVGGFDLHIRGEEILQGLFGHGSGDGLIAEGRDCGHSRQRAFQLADVLGEPFGDQVEHIVMSEAGVLARSAEEASADRFDEEDVEALEKIAFLIQNVWRHMY